MRTLKKTIVVLITAALLLQLVGISTVFAAATGSDGDFDWREISEGNVAITKYTGPGGAVQIPDTLDGSTVTQIDAAAFDSAKATLTSVSIPASISSLTANLFNGFTSLTEVTFTGTGLTEIKEGAFAGSGLTSIKIPAGVTTIEKDAFKGCAALASVTFDNVNGQLATIGEAAFSGTKLTSVRIPSSVTGIGNDAFAGCSSLATLTFAVDSSGNTHIATIGDRAFQGTGIAALDVPLSVTDIGASAFASCAKLEKVMIPGDTIEFGTSAFVRTQKLDVGGVYGHSESTAKTFCFGANIPYHLIDFAVGNTSITSATASGADRATIVWSRADRATKYELYRSESASGTFTLVKDTADRQFTNTGLKVNTAYYYKVRGYCKSGEDVYYGNYSDVVSVKPLPAAPQSLSAVSPSYNSITLKWTPVSGMTSYELWRSFTYDGTYSLVKTWTEAPVAATAVTPKSYTFTGLSTGKTYYYKVRGVQKIMSGTGKNATVVSTNYGAFSAIAYATPMPGQVKDLKGVVSTPTSVKLTWSSVSGRTGYEIWRKGPGDADFAYYNKTANNYFTNDGNITMDQSYSYKVRAYRTVSGTKIYGAFSSFVTVKPTVLQVTGVKATRSSATSIKISWSSLKGVDGYEVYWSLTGSGPWTKVQQGSKSTSVTQNGRTTGVTVYYYVVAYKSTLFGPPSEVKSATP